jgi:secondary thiamine-phosphate synthase enzyme
METLMPLARRNATARKRHASTCRHARIHVTTRHPTEFIDLTDRLETLVADAGLRFGILNVQTLHTTTAVVVNEHEPLLLTDFLALLEAAAPGDGRYHHDDPTARTVNVTDAERPNGHAHCRALLLPSSACLNVTRGRLLLGQWQRVFLVELDGPRERDISVVIFGGVGQ